MSNRDIVLLSTADWDNPFWTNKQHVAVELTRRGHRVLYIDSLGLRRPSGKIRDLKRILARLRRALRRPKKVRENLWVWSPLVLPWQKSRVIRQLNRWSLELWLKLLLRTMKMKKEWLWTYNPLTTELLKYSSFEQCIYHCVDEVSAQPGMPSDVLQWAEERLVGAANIVFTTSRTLTQSRKRWNSRTYYLPNVADYEHFAAAMSEATTVPEDLAHIKGPRLGFIGAISGYKIDFQLVRILAEVRPPWSIVLIGSVGEGEPWTDVRELRSLENVWFLGPRPYKSLPSYLKGFDVALLPNRTNEYTKSMFPMKLFEYLAAGRPIVSVDLPAIREYRDVVLISSSASEFVEKVSTALEGNVPPLGRRLAVARQHTYVDRTRRMVELIEEGHHD